MRGSDEKVMTLVTQQTYGQGCAFNKGGRCQPLGERFNDTIPPLCTCKDCNDAIPLYEAGAITAEEAVQLYFNRPAPKAEESAGDTPIQGPNQINYEVRPTPMGVFIVLAEQEEALAVLIE
jgi:hypothetical protein